MDNHFPQKNLESIWHNNKYIISQHPRISLSWRNSSNASSKLSEALTKSNLASNPYMISFTLSAQTL